MNTEPIRTCAARERLATLGLWFYDRQREYGLADYYARRAANAYMNRKAPELEYTECAELLADALARRVIDNLGAL